MQSHSQSPTPTATITFHCEYQTSISEHLHIIGNIPELGDWNESKSPRMYTSQTTYPIWYSTFNITYPIGKTIEYRYFTTSTALNTPLYESLPKRTITMKHPGQFIILTYKDSDKVKIRNISFHQTQSRPLHSPFLFESNSKYVSSLKPIELISYDNNKMGCDVINDALDIDDDVVGNTNNHNERAIFIYL